MPAVSGPYVSGGGGSRLWPIVAFLLGMALIATLVAIAFALGYVRLPETGPAGTTSPRPTSAAAATPSRPPATPTRAATAPPTGSPSPGVTQAPTPGGIHVVRSGETLFSIGLLYGVPWQAIAEANGIENPDHIELGQQLMIPLPAAPTAGATVHYVQAGESISSIALLYGVSPTELADFNNIENWDLIFVGQALLIPGAGRTPSP
jgi:LysM repeat protein